MLTPDIITNKLKPLLAAQVSGDIVFRYDTLIDETNTFKAVYGAKISFPPGGGIFVADIVPHTAFVDESELDTWVGALSQKVLRLAKQGHLV